MDLSIYQACNCTRFPVKKNSRAPSMMMAIAKVTRMDKVMRSHLSRRMKAHSMTIPSRNMAGIVIRSPTKRSMWNFCCSPVRLRIFHVCLSLSLRIDRDQAPLLPLEQVCYGQFVLPNIVKRHRTLQALEGVCTQFIDQLLVIQALCFFDSLLQHLA